MQSAAGYEVEILPPSNLISFNIREIWQYRELLYTLVWRDIKIKYKQTFLGVAWAVFQPLVSMVIFTVIFGGLLKNQTSGIPYPIFVFTGLAYWNYFSTALTQASNSLVASENIVTKIYFPRLILPLASALSPLIDFWVATGVLLGLFGYYGQQVTLGGILSVPILLAATFFTVSGLSFWLSAVNVKYRDVKYILPFFIQSLMFVTPVIYPTTLVSNNLNWLLALNPLYGVINAARAALLGTINPEPGLYVASALSGIFIFMTGLAYFRKTERFFADVI